MISSEVPHQINSVKGFETDTSTHFGIVIVGDGNPGHYNAWNITGSLCRLRCLGAS